MHSYNLACTVLVIRYKTSVLLSDILDHCLKERLEIKMMHYLNPDARILSKAIHKSVSHFAPVTSRHF